MWVPTSCGKDRPQIIRLRGKNTLPTQLSSGAGRSLVNTDRLEESPSVEVAKAILSEQYLVLLRINYAVPTEAGDADFVVQG